MAVRRRPTPAEVAAALSGEYGGNQVAAAPPAPTPELTPDLTNTAAGIAWQNMEVYGTPAPAPVRVTTTSAPAAAYTPPVDKLDLADVGWNRAFLATYPEIAALFRKGVAKGWGATKVQAEFRNTKFYKNNVESWRTTEILRLTDPKTYNQKIGNVRDELIAAAEAMGATLTGKALTSAVNQVYRLGLGGEQGVRSTQVTKLLSNYIVTSNGVLGGAAGTAQQELKALARANGVSYNDNWYTTAAKNVVGGVRAAQDYEADIRAQAASAFPVYAEQIKAGQNVADIASPYVQRMSALLEINSGDIDLFDNQIREALSGIDSSTGKAKAKSLWQFENDLRKDDRWQYTNNARERTSNVASGILRRWGLSG
jgi:hypothetical protein